MADYKKQGKRNQINGRNFENRVRADLEERGWIVSRWQNNVDLEGEKLIQAKQGRFRKTSTGFPDFIAYKRSDEDISKYYLIGVECKVNGYLNPKEREKCKWLLDRGIFNEILIASKIKIKNRVHIKYEVFNSGKWEVR